MFSFRYLYSVDIMSSFEYLAKRPLQNIAINQTFWKHFFINNNGFLEKLRLFWWSLHVFFRQLMNLSVQLKSPFLNNIFDMVHYFDEF